jgi:hypothetical protein
MAARRYTRRSAVEPGVCCDSTTKTSPVPAAWILRAEELKPEGRSSTASVCDVLAASRAGAASANATRPSSRTATNAAADGVDRAWQLATGPGSAALVPASTTALRAREPSPPSSFTRSVWLWDAESCTALITKVRGPAPSWVGAAKCMALAASNDSAARPPSGTEPSCLCQGSIDKNSAQLARWRGGAWGLKQAGQRDALAGRRPAALPARAIAQTLCPRASDGRAPRHALGQGRRGWRRRAGR